MSSTLTPVPATSSVAGTGVNTEPWIPKHYRPVSTRDHIMVRTASPDYHDWLGHVRAAAACTSPVRLAGDIDTVQPATGLLVATKSTESMPDGVIYKPCGNRRATVCPSCSVTYQRDAYQVIRTGLVGGKGVPTDIAAHPSLFVTFTAPSFGPVHTRVVLRHTCTDRKRCDCRPEPCRPRRDTPTCPHGQPLACFARHGAADLPLGHPLCLDCYDYPAHAVWNCQAGELWRRTTMTIRRTLRRTAKDRGVDPATIRITYSKVAEMQRRGLVHFHAVIRLDGYNPATGTLFPPTGVGVDDLTHAVTTAASGTTFVTDPHPINPAGWAITWGPQLDIRTINTGTGGVTDGQVAGYLAKYATKSTEATGHACGRITPDTIDTYAKPAGSHTERLVLACWSVGLDKQWRGLAKWAHMLGFGGHFLTKARLYSVTFGFLREQRTLWQRRNTTGPVDPIAEVVEPTITECFLTYAGKGWHSSGDAVLANTSAAMAREHQRVAREEMTTANVR